MTIHIAKAAYVKVSIGAAGGNSVAAFVTRGDIVPEGVSKQDLKRLTRQGFIEEIETVEPDPEPIALTQADVDAAVNAAEASKDAELANAREAVEDAARKVAADREALEQERAELAKSASPAQKAPAVKATAAKQA